MPTLRNGTRQGAILKYYLLGVKNDLVCSLSWKDVLHGLLISILLSSTILISEHFQTRQEYKVGDIAETDIRATREITIPDPQATEAKRTELINATPAVFDLNPSVVSAFLDDIQNTFGPGRRILQHDASEARISLPVSPDAAPPQRAWKLILREFPSTPFPPGLMILFFQRHFSLDFEVKITDTYLEVMRSGVVENKNQLSNYQQSGILLRRHKAIEDVLIRDVFSLRDPSEAALELRQHLRDFPELQPADRKLLFGFLESRIHPNILFNPIETDKYRKEAAHKVDPIIQRIKKDRMIARQGDEITPSMLLAIRQTVSDEHSGGLLAQFTGYFLLMGMYLYASWRYFIRLRKRLRQIHKYFVLFSLVLFMSLLLGRVLFGLCGIIGDRIDIMAFKDPQNLYFGIPFTFGSILLSLLVHTHIALFFLLSYSVLMGSQIGDFALSVYIIFGSLAAIYGINQYRERTVIIRLGLTIGIVNAMTAMTLFLLNPQPNALSTLGVRAMGGIVSGIFACMLASLLLPALENLFNIATDIRLLELSNMEHPLLRRLALEAPGTYHHSIATGTLGEAAAEAIGANPLLVRVGAYYHDIGKVFKPEYFVENQAYTSNKHENLSPHLSSLVIANHVKEGIEMAGLHRIPQQILDMIPQHHGTRVMTYFYQKAKTDLRIQDQEISESVFRYPGPKPQTKEAAILMIVDSVEAASRTLEDPTIAQIQGMIQRIVRAIIDDEQLDECNISMKDLKAIEDALLKVLGGMFHHRIEYPGYNFQNHEANTKVV